jgi:hypothetical protein
LDQEAVAIGIAAAMRKDDVFLPSFREQGAQLWRGVSLVELFLFWGGDEPGSDFAGPREDFPICVPVAILEAASLLKRFGPDRVLDTPLAGKRKKAILTKWLDEGPSHGIWREGAKHARTTPPAGEECKGLECIAFFPLHLPRLRRTTSRSRSCIPDLLLTQLFRMDSYQDARRKPPCH